MTQLTIGMPTYKDFDGVYLTLQSLRLYHDLDDTEILVVDNFGDDDTKSLVEGLGARYIRFPEAVGSAAAKNVVFEEARGCAVLCCDSHVCFPPGVIARLKDYHRRYPDSVDLLQGPLVHDDLNTILTHFDPVWRGQMWGIWATDPRGLDAEAEPFDIPMQGMGVFSCRKSAWLGFNPAFRGFGGEEGYIHEKFRRAGSRCLCLPWFRWTHRFSRPSGVPYPLSVNDKLRNYIIGFTELGLDLTSVLDHFAEHATREALDDMLQEAMKLGVSDPLIAASSPELDSHRLITSQSPVGAAEYSANGPGETDVAKTRPDMAQWMTSRQASRAIVCFVDNKWHIVQQFLALRRSWMYAYSPDTDLVAMGPESVVARLPNDIVKIVQNPVAADPVWEEFPFINAIACVNGPGASRLDDYSYLLRTDCDTFITPAWNTFLPRDFTYGRGWYSNDDHVRERIRCLAEEHGLTHRNLTNIGTSWYGPTALVRRVAGLAEMLTKRLLTVEFASDRGAWPGWYFGVAHRYASEIAVNHLAPEAQRSELLDVLSTSDGSIAGAAHIHCHHTNERFSKHGFMAGRYSRHDSEHLDVTIVRDYCLAMALQSLEDWQAGPLAAGIQPRQAKQVFTEIYDGNLWGSASVSGPGSDQDATRMIRERLHALLVDLNIRTLSDAPCGDANWITEITADLDYYFGFDIVEDIVLRNASQYKRANHLFQVADISVDILPRADAILCRDCLGHLPYDLGRKAIKNFKKSGSTFLIATTFPNMTEYTDPEIGGWCPLNLTREPYSLPVPMELLREHEPNPNDPWSEKSLGVWRLSDLRV